MLVTGGKNFIYSFRKQKTLVNKMNMHLKMIQNARKTQFLEARDCFLVIIEHTALNTPG